MNFEWRRMVHIDPVRILELRDKSGPEPAGQQWSGFNYCSCRRLLALHESFEIARTPGLAQLAQRLGLDLPNPLARHCEVRLAANDEGLLHRFLQC
jgi:hypothetical protein